MGRRKKYRQDTETVDHPCEEDESQPIAAFAANSTGGREGPLIGSPYPLNAHCFPHIQVPFRPPNGRGEQTCPSSIPSSISTQSRHHQLPPVPGSHQVCYQHQPTPHLTPPVIPFWLPHPHGYQFPWPNAPMFPSFNPVEKADISCQVPAVTGGGNSTNDHKQIQNHTHQLGSTFPGFPVKATSVMSCNGSSLSSPTAALLGQVQESQSHCSPAALTTYGYFPSQLPNVPNCSESHGQSFRKDTEKMPKRLSERHQKLWDAQSAENVKLWTIIEQLQAELDDCKGRVVKLEAEVSSMKQAAEEPKVCDHNVGSDVFRQAPKRGRSLERSGASVSIQLMNLNYENKLESLHNFQVHLRPKHIFSRKLSWKRLKSSKKNANTLQLPLKKLERNLFKITSEYD
ncbi:hypothetical protein Tsubulata_000250 [Turnera subulata]|uniref:Uncharacterized protein n=1 Tax=Turnera subulata TaxID=218843 RepID=A0A9Q0G0K4_9ROSI|nr:hypothetical protein Tsubulata_000250 [Turnera subulata]